MPALAVPAGVRAAHPGAAFEPVWTTERTATWRVATPGGETRYLKVAVPGGGPGIAAEAARLRWAANFVPVPRVIESGVASGCEWMLTAELAGTPAIAPGLIAEPDRLAHAIGRGLRRFHDTLPVAACPFDARTETLLARAHARAAAGAIDPAAFHREHAAFDVADALAELDRLRPAGEGGLVVCHGDACYPNFVIGAGGEVSGYLDLGELGIGDRWWDLAAATWSTSWNLGPGFEAALLEGYGTPPDPRRQAFFRLLYDMTG
ncbi:MAG: aminoglycoside 3'-phosphotransferase [Dehalococcoidia bacterium]